MTRKKICTAPIEVTAKMKRVASGCGLPGPDRDQESPTAGPLLTRRAISPSGGVTTVAVDDDDASNCKARGAADTIGGAALPLLAPFLPHGTQRDKGNTHRDK